MNIADRLTNRKSYEQYFTKVSKMFDHPSSRASGLISLTIFTVVFFVIFAILPTFKTIAGLTKEIKDAKITEAKLVQKIHSLEQAESLYEQVLPKLNKIDQVLPPDPDFERLAWQIYWLTDKNNLTLSSGGYGEFVFRGPIEKAKDKDINSLSINLSVQGNFSDIKNFLGDLDRLDRLVKVEELLLSNKSVKSVSQGTINASLKLVAYYLPL
jgi:Tfp pilus assembly protein PilO